MTKIDKQTHPGQAISAAIVLADALTILDAAAHASYLLHSHGLARYMCIGPHTLRYGSYGRRGASTGRYLSRVCPVSRASGETNATYRSEGL